MPFFDIQKRLGIDLDQWMTIQSAEQPHRIPSRCHAFEKEWIECAHGIGGIRAEKECKIEYDDLVECLLRQKTCGKRDLTLATSASFIPSKQSPPAVPPSHREMKRLSTIVKQRDKLIKEGKYTPPPHHSGKEDPRP